MAIQIAAVDYLLLFDRFRFQVEFSASVETNGKRASDEAFEFKKCRFIDSDS